MPFAFNNKHSNEEHRCWLGFARIFKTIEQVNKACDRNMKTPAQHIIYTIGHSTHTMEQFVAMLQSFGIKTLVDVRRFPGSRKYPHFNGDAIAIALKREQIAYIHLENLGGRRKVQKDSKYSCWRNPSFRSYAGYMETPEFENAARLLEAIAIVQPTAYMCSEAVWWRCHRAMVSDYLKAKGWEVLHIMAISKAKAHPYTACAHVEGNRVSYFAEGND